MLSYRHAYHAGNHADVLKHSILIQLLRHFCLKDAAFWVIDTHAGAGRYLLTSAAAEKLGEYREGIGRLWSHQNLSAPLADYVAQIALLNPDLRERELQHYPGSPWIARTLMRPQDSLKLFELHTTDLPLLQQNMKSPVQEQSHGRSQAAKAWPRIQVHSQDGHAALKALLPPAPRRALILMDPAYEIKQEYRQTIATLQDALRRFNTGTYAIWYPCLQHPESRNFPDQLRQLACKSWLDARLYVRNNQQNGMAGSGMFIINPPWTLFSQLETSLPEMVERLGQDKTAHYLLEQHET